MPVAHSWTTRLMPENKVKKMTGQDLGRVEEVLIDTASGEPRFAILSFGGFLGITDRLFAVPWDTLVLEAHTNTFYLRMDPQTLRALPKFSRSERHRVQDELFQSARQFPTAIAC